MTAPRVVTLTYAQRRVLGELTRDGASNATIARRLGVTTHTASSHVKALYAAFETTERAAIVAMCLHNEVTVRTVKRNAASTHRTRPSIKHGTWGGYRSHKQRDSEPCDDCTHAWDEHAAELRCQLDEGRRKRWAA